MMLIVAILLAGFAQTASSSIWAGVYTRAQAERGRLVYDTRCSRCHGGDLRGVRGAMLAGDAFALNWEARSVGRLFRMIRDTMPPLETGTLTQAEQLDTVAFVLQQNGFPDGPTELPADMAVLSGIQIRSQTGRSVVRTGALVEVSGCLTHDSDGWLLTGSSDFGMTSLEDQPRTRPSPPAVPGGRSRASGERVPASIEKIVRLMNVFPNPAPHRGHTMRAKGFLVRDRDGDRVNVVTMEMLEAACAR